MWRSSEMISAVAPPSHLNLWPSDVLFLLNTFGTHWENPSFEFDTSLQESYISSGNVYFLYLKAEGS